MKLKTDRQVKVAEGVTIPANTEIELLDERYMSAGVLEETKSQLMDIMDNAGLRVFDDDKLITDDDNMFLWKHAGFTFRVTLEDITRMDDSPVARYNDMHNDWEDR